MRQDKGKDRVTFRIHFYDGDRHPLDIEAETSAEARTAAHARGYNDGQIKTIKVVREKVDG